MHISAMRLSMMSARRSSRISAPMASVRLQRSASICRRVARRLRSRSAIRRSTRRWASIRTTVIIYAMRMWRRFGRWWKMIRKSWRSARSAWTTTIHAKAFCGGPPRPARNRIRRASRLPIRSRRSRRPASDGCSSLRGRSGFRSMCTRGKRRRIPMISSWRSTVMKIPASSTASVIRWRWPSAS